MDVKILELDPSYARALSELATQLLVATFEADAQSAEDMAVYLGSMFSPEIQARELDDPLMYSFMAFDPQKHDLPIGYFQLSDHKHNHGDAIGDPDSIQLQRIYVDEQYIGQGVGKKMLAECISKAKQLGKRAVWLSAWEYNQRAIEFYKRQGFGIVGTSTFEFGEQIPTTYLMMKSITE